MNILPDEGNNERSDIAELDFRKNNEHTLTNRAESVLMLMLSSYLELRHTCIFKEFSQNATRNKLQSALCDCRIILIGLLKKQSSQPGSY